MSGRLEGKRVLITGTAGGQGAAAARLFAAEGARVVGRDLDGERAQAVAAGIGGDMVVFAPVDLADPDGAVAWVEDAVAAVGGVDVLHHNASGHAPQLQAFLDDPSHPMHGMEAAHPLGRLGQPDDVARVALFLASDDAAYLNAIDIVVDGGQSVIV